MVGFSDLRRQVLTEAYFDELPFQMQKEVFRTGDGGRVILTLYAAGRDLEFRRVNQVYRAEIDVQTVAKDVSGRTIKVSEESLSFCSLFWLAPAVPSGLVGWHR